MTSSVVFEPICESPSQTQSLLVVIDSSVSESHFHQLRHAAFQLARTRYMYPTGKDDLIGVLQAGSVHTKNSMADRTPGGYEGLHLHLPLVTASLRALRLISRMPHTPGKTNLVNLLDVAGDALESQGARRAQTRRILLFTHQTSGLCTVSTSDHEDFLKACEILRTCQMLVDVIILTSQPSSLPDDIENFHQAFENDSPLHQEHSDDDHDHSSHPAPPPELCYQRAQHFSIPYLLALTKTTGGNLIPYDQARPLLDKPVPHSKLPMAKFYGVLDIAGQLSIPVKRYTHVSEVRPPPAKKLSWDQTCTTRTPVRVIVDTNRVTSPTDENILPDHELINAWPYGPDLIPEVNDVDASSWGIHLPRGLHVLGFVPQSSCPQSYFMKNVDVIFAMRDSPEAMRLMRTLVVALHEEKMGIIARSVTSRSGGTPTLCYLWPRIEICRDTRAFKRTYLFAVDVPMRNDMKKPPFKSLDHFLNGVSPDAHDAMDRFIDGSMLPTDPGDVSNDDDDEDAGIAVLEPDEIPNPNLDYFNVCVVQRMLDGLGGDGLPKLSPWHEKLSTPSAFLRKCDLEVREEALSELKVRLPIQPVKQRTKRGRRVIRAINGDFSTFAHYLPSDELADAEEDQAKSDESDVEDSGNANGGDKQLSEETNAISDVTGLDIGDVSEESPVEDFWRLVRSGQLRFAAMSVQVMLRRWIRSGENEEKVVGCLRALRKACVKEKESELFNDYVGSMVERCSRKDGIGARTKGMFQMIGRRGLEKETVDVIGLELLEEGRRRGFLEEIQEEVNKLTKADGGDTEIPGSPIG